MLSTVLQLLGFGCLVAAATMVSPVVGLVAAGAALLLIGHAADGVKLRPIRLRRRS